MTKIKEILKELEPYVISIRFHKGFTVVDTVFKDGWQIIESEIVGVETTDDKPNYYMLYALQENVDIDEMLDYAREVIKINLEREMKLELLKVKVNELQQIFSTTPLVKCKTLKFKFDSNVNDSENLTLKDVPFIGDLKDASVSENYKAGSSSTAISTPEEVVVTGTKNKNVIKAKNQLVDVPPKIGEKIVLEEFEEPKIVCKCGPNEICPVCESEKM